MTSGPAGRFAPSPSGDLHCGNLRTAVLAWLWARTTGRRFLLRIEDVDSQRSSVESAERQCADLARIGLSWDEPLWWQSRRGDRYAEVLESLASRGLVYECYCSRKEIQEAARAPHAIPGSYPGTCRELSATTRAARRAELAAKGRVPALRLRAQVRQWSVRDALVGDYAGEVDDMVLRRGGQAGQPRDWTYNFAVVIDDADSGVDQVVRGDDLLFSAPRQAYLAHVLGWEAPGYVHVPLVVNAQGRRLSKHDGAVTLRELLEDRSVEDIVGMLGESIGCPGADCVDQLRSRWDPELLPREPWVWRG